MENRILITYASKSGWTKQIAELLGELLSEMGDSVEVLSVEAVSNLTGYRAVVVGSGVRVGKWLPQAVNFIKSNRSQLREMPTALFTVHMLGLDDSDESIARRRAYTAPVLEMLTPVAEAFFAGGIDSSRVSFIERLMIKAVKAPEGDCCDPEAIRSWAQEVHETFSGHGN